MPKTKAKKRKAVDSDTVAVIRMLIADGERPHAIAKAMGLGSETVRRIKIHMEREQKLIAELRGEEKDLIDELLD